MSETRGIVAGVAGRYAKALFELAEEGGVTDAVRKDAAALQGAFKESAALEAALGDPSISRENMGGAMAALAEKMGLQPLTRKFLGVMAGKRRLEALPQALAGFEALVAEKRGEATAKVTAAAALTEAQRAALGQTLSKLAGGRSVHMQVEVDPELIGGLVVQLGSKMIDTSIRSKLASLQHAMKEVRR